MLASLVAWLAILAPIAAFATPVQACMAGTASDGDAAGPGAPGCTPIATDTDLIGGATAVWVCAGSNVAPGGEYWRCGHSGLGDPGSMVWRPVGSMLETDLLYERSGQTLVSPTGITWGGGGGGDPDPDPDPDPEEEFSIEDLDLDILAAAFTAGFVLMGTAWAIGAGVKVLLDVIRR